MRITTCLIALALLVPTTAFAQNRPAHRDASQQANAPRQAEHRAQKNASRSNRHVEACKRKYRSYNPRTDRYTVRPGVTRRCTL